uniref:KIB1-4 beta-propeller domain-containing protein n=1 Tax=Leersia perrieri TaxID=77586 RepID=A0A0D9VYP8_9ORYZ
MSHVRYTPDRRAKRARSLQYPSIVRNERIPAWGTKRARSRKQNDTDCVWRDWTNLGEGPAGLIADRILSNDVADYMCFRAVCRPWRLCCTDPREHNILDRRFHPRQWIMFETEGDDGHGFINLSTGRFRQVNLLPEIHGHDVFGPTSEGLLVLVDKTTRVIRLLNPFTCQATNLPPGTELFSPNGKRLENKSVKVTVAKPGDEHWTVVYTTRHTRLTPALSFAGRFYCASSTRVMVLETSAERPPRMAIAAKLARPFSMMRMDSVHLMEIDGKVMLVDRQCNGGHKKTRYKVYHVDLDARKMVPVRGLFGHAVFIGYERSVSVSPLVFPSISADTIYLGVDSMLTGTTDNCSPIHLMNGTTEPRNVVDYINGRAFYEHQRVDEYLSWQQHLSPQCRRRRAPAPDHRHQRRVGPRVVTSRLRPPPEAISPMSQVRSARGQRAKRPTRLHDPSILFDDDQSRKQASIPTDERNPIWGAKRARSCAQKTESTMPPQIVSPDWRDWTNLAEGPAELIAERLLANDVADYVSFRAVCRPWRLYSTDPREHSIMDRRFHPRQWLMFGPRQWLMMGRNRGVGSPDCRGFVNFTTGCFRYVNIPEIRGHDVFGPTSEGLLVLVDHTTHVIRLLNPFTRQVINLPPTTDVLGPGNSSLRLKVSGAGLADDSTVAVLFGEIATVAVAKPDDVHWTVVHRARGTRLLPALSFAGRFYYASNTQVMVLETSAEGPPRIAIVAKLPRSISSMLMDSVHLVEIEGKLMLVDRQSNGRHEERNFKVYHIDLDARRTVPVRRFFGRLDARKRNMVPVRGLFGHSVFIGLERSVSVSPSVFPSISADTIYLGFDSMLTATMDYSPVHLMDGTAEPRNVVNDINGRALYKPQRVDEYLSWCVTGNRD